MCGNRRATSCGSWCCRRCSAVFAFAYDGIFIGATWARDMRNLMVLSLLIFFAAWFSLRSFGNAGLWGALLVFYAARGGLQALRYPALLRTSFRKGLLPG